MKQSPAMHRLLEAIDRIGEDMDLVKVATGGMTTRQIANAWQLPIIDAKEQNDDNND